MPGPARCAILAAVLLLGGCGGVDADGETSGAEPVASATGSPTTGTATVAPTPSTEVGDGPDEPGPVVDYAIEVVATLPHDTSAFTQGLELVDGLLLESTGLRGASSIRLVEPTTGRPVRLAPIGDELFAEGATVVGDEVWQLTWTSGILLIHGLDDLTERRRLTYRGEGWGLCAGPDRLAMSDGSSWLTLRHPTTFEVVERVQILEDGSPVGPLNELECVGDLVWANVYQTTWLVAIDPGRGRVVGRVDLSELVPDGFGGDRTNVANGVAYDPDTGRFYLTGKRWPVLYEVELVPIP